MIHIDFSQIEMRIAALNGLPTAGGDIHAQKASELYGVPEDQVTPDQRRVAKTYNFGEIYGSQVAHIEDALDQLTIPERTGKKWTKRKRWESIAAYLKRQRKARSRSNTQLCGTS